MPKQEVDIRLACFGKRDAQAIQGRSTFPSPPRELHRRGSPSHLPILTVGYRAAAPWGYVAHEGDPTGDSSFGEQQRVGRSSPQRRHGKSNPSPGTDSFACVLLAFEGPLQTIDTSNVRRTHGPRKKSVRWIAAVSHKLGFPLTYNIFRTSSTSYVINRQHRH